MRAVSLKTAWLFAVLLNLSGRVARVPAENLLE